MAMQVGYYYRFAAVLVAAAAILFCSGVEGQVAAPGPSPDCMTYLLNASDCLTYVTEGSTLKKPDKGCCGELAGLVDSNPICLCYLLSSNNSFGLQFDVKKALNLPSICKVTTPPVSLCSEIGIPVGAPTSSSNESDQGMAPTPSSSESTTQLSPSSSSSSSYTSPGSSPSGSSSSGCGSSTMAPSALLFLFTLPFALAATSIAFSF